MHKKCFIGEIHTDLIKKIEIILNFVLHEKYFLQICKQGALANSVWMCFLISYYLNQIHAKQIK